LEVPEWALLLEWLRVQGNCERRLFLCFFLPGVAGVAWLGCSGGSLGPAGVVVLGTTWGLALTTNGVA